MLVGAVLIYFFSPYKFRRGHAVYTLKLTKDIAELKVASQNLMRANISTTDGAYGMVSEMNVKGQIESLGQTIKSSENKSNLIMLTKQ